MYSFQFRDNVPSGGLACLLAKATTDELTNGIGDWVIIHTTIPSSQQSSIHDPNPSASPSFTQILCFLHKPIFSQTAVPLSTLLNLPSTYWSASTLTDVQTHSFNSSNSLYLCQHAKISLSDEKENMRFGYEVEYWVQNVIIILCEDVKGMGTVKRLEKMQEEITIVPPLFLLMDVAVQRENRFKEDEGDYAQTSSIQILVTEKKALHKRLLWTGFRKILSQLNQVQATADNDDINLKSLELDVISMCHSYGVKVAMLLYSFAFISAALGSKLNLFNQQRFPSGFQPSVRSDSIMECVLHSFVAENEPDQDMIYEDFDQVDQLEMEELDLKWQMAMLRHYTNVVKTLESQKDWYHKTQIALEEKIRILTANLENTANTLSYTEQLHDQAQKEKKEWEVKFEATLARFDKWKESSKNLKKLINSSMSTRTKIGLGFQEYFGVDEVFDLSTPSVIYPEPVEKEGKPLYSRFVRAGEMHAVPPPITGTYMPISYKPDIDETQVSYGSKSVNTTSETLSESNDFVSCDNSDKSSDSETYASCDSSLKTKTKDFPPAVDITTVPESDVEDPNSTDGSPSFSCLECLKPLGSFNIFYVGSRKFASISSGGGSDLCSGNRPAVNSAGRPNPAGWSKRPATVSAGRPVSAGWLNPAARPYFRPSSVNFNNMYWPDLYDPMYMTKGRGGTAGDPSTDNDIGIVDSGCSRSMTGNKEKLVDFVQIKGGIVKFGGGDGTISGKGTIRTSKLDFENVYYVEELQHFNLFSVSQICDKKNKVLFTDTDCLVLTEEFQLPDESQVVLRIPREHDLYTFSISDLQPDQNVTCLVAKASLDESTRWHRRMAHVNFKTINKLAKEGLVDGLPLKIGHLKPFGCQVTILNTSDHLGKFEGKADEGYLVGYATNSKAYRVDHLTNKRVEETMNLRFLEDKPNVQGIGHEWYFDLDYLTDSLGYTRFKTDKPAGTQETNKTAGTQDHDSDLEVDEQVIVVPSFPSNSFAGPSSSNGPSVMERNADYAEELAKLQRQEYEAKDAAARYGYLFSQETAEILSQAEAEIRNQGVFADRDPTGMDSASGVFAGSAFTGSDPADGNPAGSFNPASSFHPAGSYEPAGQSNPAVSTSVSADFIPVQADESTLPPGQQLGSSENTTRFPVPSDVCMDQISSGIFTSSSYDDDFRATLTNLAPAVEVNPVPTKRVNTIHPQSQILGDLASPVMTRSRAQKSKFGESAFIGYIQDQQRTNHTDQLHCLSACFLSQLEPTSIAKALEDPDWVDAMQEEMQQFINQQVWKLVPLPVGKHAIGTKWILKNKRDARGIVVRNKARLVAQGHRQEEGIDYDEVFAPVARIEAIRLFLAFASYMGFLVYQLDVKSAFLYGEIEEEVYVTQPKGFEDPYFPKHVYRVVKALYGLHQAPRAWYARLSTFLLQHNYRRGTIDKTLFIKKDSRDIILVQVYVDDIIFGSTNKAWCDEFEVLMKGEFEMSAMGEMTFFLGLQVKQLPDGLFISQDKYVKDMLTKFDMESVRTATTPYEAAKTKLKDETDPPVNVHLYRSMIGSLMYLTASRPDIMFAVSACSRHQVTPLTSHLNAVKKIFKYLKGQPKLGLWYPKDSPFQLEAYSDSDYAGSHGDRKSTTGGCQFLGRRLISWQCKKQTIVATSSTEAEYVAAASCCAQVLWIQNQLLDYGFNFMNTKIFIDNQSTICIVKNPVFHQRTKHIEIRHHFIRDANEKNLIQVLKI
ncbi:putative ribonuclease H-like domain-containing protein [Tanacetum coccineum]